MRTKEKAVSLGIAAMVLAVIGGGLLLLRYIDARNDGFLAAGVWFSVWTFTGGLVAVFWGTT